MMDAREAMNQIAAILCPNALTFSYDDVVRAAMDTASALDAVNAKLDEIVQAGAELTMQRRQLQDDLDDLRYREVTK